jgi:hypothetical protein
VRARDLEWYEANMPARRRPVGRKARRDWAAQDAAYCEALARVLHEGAHDDPAPRRTLIRLAVAVGLPAYELYNHAHDLPNTIKALEGARESHAVYVERQRRAAAGDLQREDV